MVDYFQKAPVLLHSGADNCGNIRFYRVMQDALDVVLNELDGKHGNEIKIMVVLLGTLGDGSFRASE